MKAEEPKTAVPAARRHIIRRPRLTRMLDESGARIILLVAPAGYGKTTLAHEWLEVHGWSSVWYRAGSGSSDVAAFALGLARVAAQIVPRAGLKMAERLRSTSRPEDEATILGEMLGEDLRSWPDDAWLVIDDYHYASSRACEIVLEELLASSERVRVLVASRRRPGWASARRRAYGEFTEIDRTALALTNEEAVAVLNQDAEEASALVERAAGWPAVLGMAAATGEVALPHEPLPSTLYDYFAEELYQGIDEFLRGALHNLTLAPAVDPELARFLFGSRSSKVIDAVIGLGAATSDDDGLVRIHPLFQNFMETKLVDFGDENLRRTLNDLGHHLLAREKWDDVFRLVERFGARLLLVELADRAVERLLTEGRAATVRRWIDVAGDRGWSAPILDFAEAELAFRDGLMQKTELLALRAASGLSADSPWTPVALTRAGRAAHMDGRETDALRSHRAAIGLSPPPAVRREALWGCTLSYIELERIDDAHAAFAELEHVGCDSVDDLLRLASGRYLLALRAGGPVSADDLLRAAHLIDESSDAMARSSFVNACSAALIHEARYDEAEPLVRRQIDDAAAYRLRFVLPYGYLRLAAVHAGRRHFADAQGALDTADRSARESGHPWIGNAVRIARGSLLLSMGQAAEALAVMGPGPDAPASASLRGEALALRALALAAIGDHGSAADTLREAESTSCTLEIRSLAAFVRALISADPELAYAAFDFSVRHGTADHFVMAYRSAPWLLAVVAGKKERRLEPVLVRARDTVLAREVGINLSGSTARKGNLSPRELDVLSMLSQGLTNKAIADALYISPSTVKVHIRHIFEKLNARTRTEAAAKGRALAQATIDSDNGLE